MSPRIPEPRVPGIVLLGRTIFSDNLEDNYGKGGTAMKASRLFLQVGLAALAIGACLPTVTFGQRPAISDTSFVEPLVPTATGITIQQVSFVFDAGRAVNTDWGQIQIDPVRWGNVTGMNSGYVHLVLYSDSSARPPKWVVRNLYLPPALVGPCPADSGGATSDPAGGSSTTPPGSGPALVAVFRHQGGAASYGENTSCDDGTVVLGGLVSTREGLHPTWQWFFDQLQHGRGVAMCFERYDIQGNRTSGHMVRVWGARRFNGKDYLYTLDDSNQGPNTTGLRNQVWEVADTGQPGFAGMPDGQLNMNGSSWEIEFATSAEARPTLLIP
jgi:hypothetical protein